MINFLSDVSTEFFVIALSFSFCPFLEHFVFCDVFTFFAVVNFNDTPWEQLMTDFYLWHFLVVGELDDLSKRKEQNPGVWKSGSAPKPTKLDLSRLALPANEHDKSKRAENSLKALQYIEVAMMDKRNCFMVKTSKGVLAHSTKIRNLFDGQNDDAIIATALCQIPSDHNEPIRAPDGSIYVKREVVLLTDDRNLILKSIYVNSLPATSIQEFVKLYNLNS